MAIVQGEAAGPTRLSWGRLAFRGADFSRPGYVGRLKSALQVCPTCTQILQGAGMASYKELKSQAEDLMRQPAAGRRTGQGQEAGGVSGGVTAVIAAFAFHVRFASARRQ